MRKFALGFISFPLAVFALVLVDKLFKVKNLVGRNKQEAYTRKLMSDMTPEARARLILLDSTKG